MDHWSERVFVFQYKHVLLVEIDRVPGEKCLSWSLQLPFFFYETNVEQNMIFLDLPNTMIVHEPTITDKDDQICFQWKLAKSS
ncbi:hypothetical protein G4V62_03380 [Bacillaceae bacterium SIJ1]|uniref:hypothetical protein n=1 Tax=Litoribacterium kuwaitense TaxID=1398745 RepID=UPI0013EAD2C5|nr:hypothetical protein [Litoribacterium kuwaitense]NGP44036.1 hypothetical protein [Litoribacterium kuwaitense]